MIAIDTNILLRYLLEDDEKQSAQATRLIQGKQKVLVTDAALVETIWTLKGKKYQLAKSEIIETILQLFQETNLRFEDGQVVWKAPVNTNSCLEGRIGMTILWSKSEKLLAGEHF